MILELGAGQGWASCLLKHLVEGPKHTAVTDVSADAIASVPMWEGILRTTVDETHACSSFDLNRPDASVDLVFAFQAAHHFGAHRRTLAEVHRVLRPGGGCLYLHEPTSPRWAYAPAVRRVNRKRASYGDEVVEDVIVGDRLLELARDAGLRPKGIRSHPDRPSVQRVPVLPGRQPPG